VKRVVRLNAFLVQWGGKFLLRRRPLGGLWGGLWEIPLVETHGKRKEAEGESYAPLNRLRESGTCCPTGIYVCLFGNRM
jgi:adenine-specific DNA glycosylase